MRQVAAAEPRCSVTVSYTHLDVYKRQVSATNDKFESGYLGLMTFGGSVTYQDVKYTDLGADATAPGLTGLEVTGGSLELTPEFDPEVTGYTYFAGYADSVTVTPVSYTHLVTVDNLSALEQAMRRDHVCAKYTGNVRGVANFQYADCIPMDCDNDHSDNPDDWKSPEDVKKA